jgi:hypothetical protein
VQFISPSFADEIVSLLENLDTTVTFVGGSQLLWERFSEVIERRGANIPLDSDPTRYTVYA